MSEKRQFNLDLSNNLNSENLSSVRTDRSQLSEFLGSEIRHFRKKLRDQSQENSVGRLLNQMNIGKTSYKNKHMRKTSSVNRFTSPFQEQFVIGMGEDNVLDLLAAPLDSRAVLQFYKNNNSKPRVQSVEKTENPIIIENSKKQTSSHYEQAKSRINKNKAVLNLAEKLKLIMMDNVKLFFIRANFIAAIRAVDQKSTTVRQSRRTHHQEPKANFDKTNEMILKLKNFQQELSSNVQHLNKPKEERKKSTDKTYNFSLANTPRNFSGKIIPPSAGTTSNLETAKYAMMLPKRSENNIVKKSEVEEVPRFTSEESEAQSPSFALHTLQQEANPPPQIANFKSFLSSNSGKTGQSPNHENLPTDPSQPDSQNQSLRTTFLKDSVILQPSNNKLPECSPNSSTISNSSKSQNHLQEKSSEILSFLLNQSQSLTPAKKVNNTTLDSNFQDGAVELSSSSSSLAENVSNSNPSRQSDFLSKMKSLSQEILTPEKVTPKKSDPATVSQSSQSKSRIYPVAKLEFHSIDDKKKILSETSSLSGLISALEAKEAKEAKIKAHHKSSNPAAPTSAKEDETFNQIIKELSPSSSIITPSSRKREEQGAETEKHQQDLLQVSTNEPNKVMKIQVLLLQKVQPLKRITKIFNKYNGMTFAFAQMKEHHQAPRNEKTESHRSPSMGGRMNSLDLSPNSYGFALGLDKISETDSMAASARNRGSQAIFTGRSTPMSQNHSSQFMQQRIQSALQIEKVLSNCLTPRAQKIKSNFEGTFCCLIVERIHVGTSFKKIVLKSSL